MPNRVRHDDLGLLRQPLVYVVNKFTLFLNGRILGKLTIVHIDCFLNCNFDVLKSRIVHGVTPSLFYPKLCRHNRVVKLAANVLALGAVADFGAQNCQYTTKVDARQNVQLTTSPAIEPNACQRLPEFVHLFYCYY